MKRLVQLAVAVALAAGFAFANDERETLDYSQGVPGVYDATNITGWTFAETIEFGDGKKWILIDVETGEIIETVECVIFVAANSSDINIAEARQLLLSESEFRKQMRQYYGDAVRITDPPVALTIDGFEAVRKNYTIAHNDQSKTKHIQTTILTPANAITISCVTFDPEYDFGPEVEKFIDDLDFAE